MIECLTAAHPKSLNFWHDRNDQFINQRSALVPDTDRNRHEQTGTEGNRKEQAETDRNRRKHTGTFRNRQEQTGTDRNRHVGSFLLVL